MNPLVSILSFTYNQEDYVAQALDSFISQKTDFSFEVIINDDASTDNTQAIIRNFQTKYPDIIKPVFQKTNQYSNNDWHFINDLYRKASGKYIATCEGDDYWTDSHKLQKQVDYMEANPECTLCFHPVNVLYENGEKESYISPGIVDDASFTVEELVKKNFINTSSVLYRSTGDYENLERKVMPQDLYLHLYHAQNGYIHCLQDAMSVYRRQPSGVWWSSDDEMDKIYNRFGILQARFFASVLDMFPENEEIHKSILQHYDYLLGQFIKIDQETKSDLTRSTIKEFTDLTYFYVTETKHSTDKISTENKLKYDELDVERKRLEKVLLENENEVIRLRLIEDEKSKQLDIFFGSSLCRLYYRIYKGIRRRLNKS